MAFAANLAQHILSLEPDKDAARLCFYHYLKNLCEAQEPINSELMNRFFARALTFTHWQENKGQLFNEVGSILHHYQQTHHEALPVNEMIVAEQIQVVPTETLRTLELVIGRYIERHASPYDQYRIVPEGDDKIVCLTLQGDRSLKATVFPKVLAIRDGELTPLCQDFTLYYSADLQLHPMMLHQIDVGPHAAARFFVNADGVHGIVTRGYTFQKYSVMDGGGLHKYPVLFYPLKRLEQFFVNRKSDPMYIELTGLLEKALELMSAHHPEAVKFASAAIDRGRLALEHIFPDDKLVRLLINNLEKTLALDNALGMTRRAAEADVTPEPSFESGHDPIHDLAQLHHAQGYDPQQTQPVFKTGVNADESRNPGHEDPYGVDLLDSLDNRKNAPAPASNQNRSYSPDRLSGLTKRGSGLGSDFNH